jgi:hypothetical protein
VVFNTAGAAVKAVMKGTQLSNNSSAFADNGQHKIIQTENGNLFLTYESMGQIWLEMSADNGRTWDFVNYNLYLDYKNPSLALDGKNARYFYLVCQNIGSDSDISIYKFDEDGTCANELDMFQAQNNTAEANPAAVSTKEGDLIIFFVNNDGVDPGIYYYALKNNNGTLQYVEEGKVSGTSSSSIKPTAAIDPKSGPGNKNSSFITYLAWQENNNIKFDKIWFGSDMQMNGANSIETPSSGSGYSQNTDPSIAFSNGRVQLAWHGYKKVISKGDKAGTVYNNIVLRERASLSWGQFLVYGNNAFYPSISANYNGDDYYFAWNEHPAQNKYVVGSNNHINGFLSTSTNYI